MTAAGPERAATPADGLERPGLVYIRIPKTASSTVAHQMLSVHEFWKAMPGARPRVQRRREFRHGHVTLGCVRQLLEPGAGWIAIATLRDPMERIISQDRYLQRSAEREDLPGHVRAACEEAVARPLSELVLDQRSLFHPATYATQTFYLGTDLKVDRLGILQFSQPPDSDFTLRSLRLALERLEWLAWIGLAETLERDLETLGWSQGWPPFAPLRLNSAAAATNRMAASSDLDADARCWLADRLAADFQLVEAAREIAAERHRAMTGGDPRRAAP